jgi:tetratricopeptide (TPR) repeat protein
MATLASQRGVDSISKDARRENFRCVIDDLECAVEYAGASSTGNLHGLGWLHHWLGRFHVELLHFDVGVSHLQIAAALGHEPVQSRIWRAYGLLDARAFARAAQAFREARLEFCKSRRGGTSITNPADRVMEIGLGYALCLIESRGNLRHAARLLRCCHRSAWTTLSPESRSEYRALWSAARGKLSLIEGKVEEAIHQLRQSLQILPTSLAYLWLAEATLRTGDAARRQQVTEYLDLAEHLDLRDLHQDRIQALRRSLQPNQ